VAGAPCGPHRGSPANLAPDLKSKDRSIGRKVNSSPLGGPGRGLSQARRRFRAGCGGAVRDSGGADRVDFCPTLGVVYVTWYLRNVLNCALVVLKGRPHAI
jgi:hypothetical protein